jgi:phospholipid transport system transporter-binding protein
MKQDDIKKEPECTLVLSASDDGIGKFLLTGVMNFESVIYLNLRANELFQKYSSITVDLSGVTYVNSAGLALLLEWKRKAVLENRMLEILGAPKKLLNIARVSEIEDILSFQLN